MPNYTSVLSLTGSELQRLNQQYYHERAAFDAAGDSTLGKIDAFAGKVTGSFQTHFAAPGSGSNATVLLNSILPLGYLGSAFSPIDRVITEVLAWAATSGSGGVTRVDVQVQQGSTQPANFSSIFSNNAYKPALSSSLGNFYRVSATTFVSGTNMVWAASSSLIAGSGAKQSGSAGCLSQIETRRLVDSQRRRYHSARSSQ